MTHILGANMRQWQTGWLALGSMTRGLRGKKKTNLTVLIRFSAHAAVNNTEQSIATCLNYFGWLYLWMSAVESVRV